MKQIKNAMFAIVGGLLLVTVASVSCKKSSDDGGGGGTPPPVITDFTPKTAGAGETVTITGTDLAGATSVKFGGVTAASITSNSATEIKAVVGTGATGEVSVTTAGGTATKAGFTFTAVVLPTSNDVATADLLAHWTFDTDSKEIGSGIAANQTVGTVTYASAGKIGNAATFTNGALVYPAITPQINHDTALQSYSVSLWLNIPVQTGAEGLRSLFQVNGNRFPDLFGLVALELLNAGAKGDTLQLQARQIQVDGNAPYVHNETATLFGAGTPLEYVSGAGKWTFVTMTYDGSEANQTIKLYANGLLVKTKELTTVTKPETFRVVPTGGSATPTPANMVTIGTFAFNDFTQFAGGDGYGNFTPTAVSRPWAQNGITGQIDDLRLFGRPLTQAEVTNLYTYGLAGR